MSGDFLNFGATALNIAGTAAIAGEAIKMLSCEHCGSEHKSRVSLMRHHKMMHQQKSHKHYEERGEPHRTGHTSKGDDYDFDFRI